LEVRPTLAMKKLLAQKRLHSFGIDGWGESPSICHAVPADSDIPDEAIQSHDEVQGAGSSRPDFLVENLPRRG
jgi:hypothetical protein